MKLFFAICVICLGSGCVKKTSTTSSEIKMIERDTDILSEEDLEELPESK
jgi:hypothetical protein